MPSDRRMTYDSPRTLSRSRFRADLAHRIDRAADMRRRGLFGLARNFLDLAHRIQWDAFYWQPIP